MQTPAYPEHARTFTFEEANKALAYVNPVMKEVVQLWKEASVLQKHGHDVEDQEIKDRLDRIEYCLAELDQVGCIMKDLPEGLIDFPTYYQHELVELCWKVGEEKITSWHPIGTGYRERRPIDTHFKEWNDKKPVLSELSLSS